MINTHMMGAPSPHFLTSQLSRKITPYLVVCLNVGVYEAKTGVGGVGDDDDGPTRSFKEMKNCAIVCIKIFVLSKGCVELFAFCLHKKCSYISDNKKRAHI